MPVAFEQPPDASLTGRHADAVKRQCTEAAIANVVAMSYEREREAGSAR